MKKKRGFLRTTFLILLLFIGIALIFYNQIETFLVSSIGDHLSIDRYSVEDIERNKNKDASFDFEEVQSLSIIDVLKAQANLKDLPVIGSIAIPAVDLQLPILKGVSKQALSVGAGTMKPDQQMGKGNYALASHYMENKDILFAPLYDAKNGDNIYISDLQNIYEYVVTDIKVIEATDVHIIDDIPNKSLLSLITCAEKGKKRLSVRADFVTSYPFEDAPAELTSAF